MSRFLANPAMKSDKMPNLGLSGAEIAALSAFITGERSGRVD